MFTLFVLFREVNAETILIKIIRRIIQYRIKIYISTIMIKSIVSIGHNSFDWFLQNQKTWHVQKCNQNYILFSKMNRPVRYKFDLILDKTIIMKTKTKSQISFVCRLTDREQSLRKLPSIWSAHMTVSNTRRKIM